MPTAPRTVVVVGATGNQGSGVVRALLGSKSTGSNLWLVRGLTRDPNSAKAKNFLAEHQTVDGRLTLVPGHVYDKASLRDAFAGAYGVFAMTSESYPGRVLSKKEEMQHEIEAGCNMVLAAAECGIKHFVFSSLPDMAKTTGGRFLNIHHMNNKHAIEQIAREKLSGLTCLIPGSYCPWDPVLVCAAMHGGLSIANAEVRLASDCLEVTYAWRLKEFTVSIADGVVQFRIPIPGNQTMQWTDPIHDMGTFAARVFNLGIEKTHGKSYLVLGPRISADEMVKTFTRVTGQAAVHEPMSAEEFGELAVPFVGPAFKEDAQEMMEWIAVMPADKICYGALDADQDHSVKELGLSATSFESWLYRSGWRGPA